MICVRRVRNAHLHALCLSSPTAAPLVEALAVLRIAYSIAWIYITRFKGSDRPIRFKLNIDAVSLQLARVFHPSKLVAVVVPRLCLVLHHDLRVATATHFADKPIVTRHRCHAFPRDRPTGPLTKVVDHSINLLLLVLLGVFDILGGCLRAALLDTHVVRVTDADEALVAH